jgi:GT2 family glycosyltransferase
LYWEDVDFGYRLRRNGWRLAVAGKAVVLHKENGSTAGKAELRDRYSTASCLRFLRQWAPVPSVSMGLFLASRFGKRAITGQLRRMSGVYLGARDYYSRPAESRRDVATENVDETKRI